MVARAVVALRSSGSQTCHLHSPRRLWFEQESTGDCCTMKIDVGDDLEVVRELVNGHVVVLESGDARIPDLHFHSKCLAEMPFKVKQVELAEDSAEDLLLIASIPRLDISPGFPGSGGVIGRRCLLVNSLGAIVAEGLMGWGA